MARPILTDAFGHHIWATVRLIDACLALDDDQVDATAPGTYGSIVDTMRHIVAADNGYLYALTGGRTATPDAYQMELVALRLEMEANQAEWAALLEQDLDPDTNVIRHREDGSESHAPLGVRLAQALHHGTDHRSQICTILTTLGVEPPDVSVWEYAERQGRLHETPPTT